MNCLQPAIEFEDVSFKYDHSPILTNVNFSISAKDTVCVIGQNGGGKTTLVKLILGLLVPDKGTVKVYGNNPQKEAGRIGYVPQYTLYDPSFPISAYEVVCMGRLDHAHSSRYTDKDRQKTMAALKSVGIEKLANRPFSSLSGGQRQRTLIARALAPESDILILDEPTSNIDHRSEQQLFDLLALLNQQMTIIMVTHEIGFASSFFTRVICVNNTVAVHPTSQLTGDLIRNMYNDDLRMIRHDHHCSNKGHTHGG
jgi:zinc transport system ATP-binding protein